jgi:predicted NACHT family NTPase
VLQWLAVRAARSDFTGRLATLNGYFPFYIRLREYVGKRLPAPEDFVTNIAPMWAGEVPVGWIRSRLRTGKALVLIDGVDELPHRQREKVSGWLEELAQLFPDVRYIVTARPTAISEDWLTDHDFKQISLQAMSPLLMRKFVSHWYEAARHRTNDSDERELLRRYETSLLASINDDIHLRDLADTPLLAGLLCSLNRHLRSHLPRRRSEIYERAIVMFDQRDRIREINTEGFALEATSKILLLADLAFWMIRNGESEVEIDTAQKVIRRSLGNLAQADLELETIFRLLLERSGLLRKPMVGKVDFVHRTFQEYLAARAAIHEDAIGELLRNAEEVQWREVVLLAAGQANRPQATRLLQGLLGRTSHGSRSRRRLFAISCLQEIRSIDEALRQSVLSRLPTLLPPTSMDQARELSGAGTRLIPPLTKEWIRAKTHAAETIRGKHSDLGLSYR